MNCVLLIGLQASGKSTFCRQRFGHTHVRINLDMLRTRHREQRLIETCREIQQPFVVDNTNISRAARQRYFELLRGHDVSITGYYFQSEIEACKRRNAERPKGQQVPLPGLLGTAAKLELPTLDEGFAALSYVRIGEDGDFIVEEWRE